VTRDESRCQCWGPVGAGQFWEKTKEILKISRQCRKIGERTRNRGKEVPKKEENQCREKQLQSGKLLWSSWKVDKRRLGEWLDHGPAKIKSRRKWTNLIHLGLGFL
jgi:hypothetical protein